MFIQEHNCETGEITLRDLTAKELEQRQKYLLKEINKLDGYIEDTVHKQLFGI